MTNNRQKGKRGERLWKNELKEFWPTVRRNANGQSQMGGKDLLETGIFAWEIKYGKSYKSKMIRDVIEQAKSETGEGEITMVGMTPDREQSYVIMTLDGCKKLLHMALDK